MFCFCFLFFFVSKSCECSSDLKKLDEVTGKIHNRPSVDKLFWCESLHNKLCAVSHKVKVKRIYSSSANEETQFIYLFGELQWRCYRRAFLRQTALDLENVENI